MAMSDSKKLLVFGDTRPLETYFKEQREKCLKEIQATYREECIECGGDLTAVYFDADSGTIEWECRNTDECDCCGSEVDCEWGCTTNIEETKQLPDPNQLKLEI